jgi:HK97 family phage major capsid protein
MTDAVELVKQIGNQIEGIKAEQSKIDSIIKDSATKNEAEVKALAKVANEAAEKVQAMAANIIEIEQKLGEKVIASKAAPKTWSDVLFSTEQFKAYAAGNGAAGFRIEANTITGQSGSPATNNDVLQPNDRRAGYVPLAYRSLNVLDVIPVIPTTANAVEVTREATRTNNAAGTLEGAVKPESAITYQLVTTPIRTIATFLKISNQVLSDAAALRVHVDVTLQHMVQVALQNGVISGAGTGQTISGILASGNHTVYTPASANNAIDSVNRMIEAVAAADYNPTTVLLSVADWHAIERTKVGSGDDRYVIGDPAGGALSRRLWGLPVVVSNSITPTKGIVFDADMAYKIYMRESVAIGFFEEDTDNVQRNLVTVRAEMRAALGTERPQASVAGSLIL